MASLDHVHSNIQKHGQERVIYLDECAAGVLAGDLFVCGIMFPADFPSALRGAKDSKTVSEAKRAAWFPLIQEACLDVALVRITPPEVDKLNVLQARMEGFRRAIEQLTVRQSARYAVIDGNRLPSNLSIEADFLIKGDALLPGISCASIYAKHSHTQYMKSLCQDPQIAKYGFLNHKGYGTQEHLSALEAYGPIEGFHRYSYAPVKATCR